ncbi:Uncharacterized protein TPAR_06575 [Tolypocladium paradoxum]|uniref:Uncharacterized protein n=1 Tax=Tolypocladium paradoxum TaxID=94208 RepID=A0A2S4KSR8_9HYPO|nr:Uncharacterized protein TPAR_06575 [Tolypocladium paradoxum]
MSSPSHTRPSSSAPRCTPRQASAMGADPLASQMEVAEPITPAGSAGSASRKAKDEFEWRKSRLADPSFNIKKYPDPLAPRQGVDPKFYPKGVTLDMEKTWLAKIQALKDGAA